MSKARKGRDLNKLDFAKVEERAAARGLEKALKNQKEKVSLVIAVNKENGRKSAGIILNKKEGKTYVFFFDPKKEYFKPGYKVMYKLNSKTGLAYKVTKI